MLKSYLSIVLRYMARHKGFSLINLFGLTIGIACSLLIVLYIHDELSYDTFHPDANRIYRVTLEGNLQGKKIRSPYVGTPLGPTLFQITNNIEAVTRLASWATFPMRFGNRAFTETNLILADSNFFSFFNFTLIEGHPDSVLSHERDLVITESAAKRYFNYTGPGDKSPIGKTMILAQGYTATISGIAADPPRNSHFSFPFVLSLRSWPEAIQDKSWINGRLITYVKLKSAETKNNLQVQLDNFVITHVNRELKELRQISIDQFSLQGNKLKFSIQPLLSIHLRSDLDEEIGINGDIQYIYLFGAIAVFITLLACINFVNLSTARSASRAKEVGVRKTVGAAPSRLVGQFLLESYFYIFLAVLFALALIIVALVPFNFFTGKSISASFLLTPTFLVILAALIIVVGILAGSYPAFYLTHFTPIEVLKGRVRTRIRSYGIRNVLVVFQFMISTGLIIATLIVYLQLLHLQTLNIGFDKRNIVNLLHTKNLGAHAEAFKKDLLSHPEILSASYCNRLPPNIDWQYVFSSSHPKKDYLLAVYEMDYDHLKTMNYKMVSGRFFSPDHPNDSMAVILNETAAKKIKMSGRSLHTLFGNAKGMDREVIGVMQDFNFQSVHDPIQPMAIVLGFQPNWEMAIRVSPDDPERAIELIRTTWIKHSPHAPFEFSLLEKNFDDKNKTERKISFLFLGFTLLAVVIACLGLFGLATFTAEQRTKEIGIRKVMGASEGNIIGLLNKDFMRLVVIANLIAWPVTGWLMYLWLGQFAYHISLPWWVFLTAAVISLLDALLAISFRAIKAAKGNPVDSLRNE